MSTTETTKVTQEYRNIPIGQLKESSTNPRKRFDDAELAELAESIRSKGVLLPLLVLPCNGHFEIVAGDRRYRASKLAGCGTVPATIRELTDEECLEIQLIENLQRTDLHPFEEAQGFRALLDKEGRKYTIEKIAAKTGKSASFVARRLKLLDLIKPAADAFLAEQIGVEHAQLIAKLTPDTQEKALAHCFDGYYGVSDGERSLVPVSRLESWIEQNVYLRLKSVPFSKEDDTLLPDAGSCASCPKRTGFNTLLFSDVREDSCTDAACFNRKLDAHIARRKEKMPELVLISNEFSAPDGAPILTRRNYVEVVAQKGKGQRDSQPWNRTCNNIKTAIHTDGVDKGRLARVCAEPSCKVHFAEQQQAEKQRLASKAQRAADNRKAKQTASFRYLLLAETLKHVRPQLNSDQLRLVARFVIATIPHEQAVRLAKRHGIEAAKNEHDWHVVEKARNLYKTAGPSELARLIFEAMLVGSAANGHPGKNDDLLSEAAKLYEIDVKALRVSIEKAEKKKPRKTKRAARKYKPAA